MKYLVSLLALFSFPAYAMVFAPTDLDIDFTLQGNLIDPEAFFAVVTPDGIDDVGLLAGGAVAVPAPLGPISGQITVVDFPAPFADAADPVGFEVGLFYNDKWEKPDSITFTGGDTWLFDWSIGDVNPDTATLLMSDVQVVPIPTAAWLFASGILGIVGVARRGPSSF